MRCLIFSEIIDQNNGNDVRWLQYTKVYTVSARCKAGQSCTNDIHHDVGQAVGRYLMRFSKNASNRIATPVNPIQSFRFSCILGLFCFYLFQNNIKIIPHPEDNGHFCRIIKQISFPIGVFSALSSFASSSSTVSFSPLTNIFSSSLSSARSPFFFERHLYSSSS